MDENIVGGGQPVQTQESAGTQLSCRLQGIRHYISEMLNVYKNNFLSFIIASAIPVIAVYLFIFGIAGYLIAYFLAGQGSATPSFSPLHLVLLIVGFIAIFLVSILSNLALLYLIKERENKLGLGACFQKALSTLGSNIVITLFLFVLVAGGLVFFIVPGILFAMWYCFSLYVLVDEGKKGMAALRRSKEIIGGYIGAYFGRVVLFGILIGIVNYILGFITSHLPFQSVFSGILSAILTPASLIFSFLIYEDIKKSKAAGCTKSPRELKYTLALLLILLIIPIFIIATIIMGTRGSKEKASRVIIIGSLDSMRSSAELYYDMNNSYQDLDSSSDAQRLEQSIINARGSDLEIKISPDGQKYCLHAQISAKEGYWCVDSNGSSANGQCSPEFSCEYSIDN